MFPIVSHQGLAQIKCIVWDEMGFKEFQDVYHVAMVSKFYSIPYVFYHTKLHLNPKYGFWQIFEGFQYGHHDVYFANKNVIVSANLTFVELMPRMISAQLNWCF